MNPMFDNTNDPFDRLNQLEIDVMAQQEFIETISEQLKSQSRILEYVSGYMIEIAQGLNSQHKMIMDMNRHIRSLEKNASKE